MNRELKKARDQAMAASDARSQFLARMSHEFRTPLNAVLGYTELLLENVDDLDPEQMASDLQHIQTSGEQLQRLIGDVLDLTKIDSGRLDLEPTAIDLPEVVDEVTANVRPMLDESDNEVVVDVDQPDFELRTDETKLRQLLLSLSRNAAKITDDGTVTLSVEPAGDEDQPRVAFEVNDTGIGMAYEEQAAIFEPFFQADDSSTSRYRGTGLGLTLVQRFAERMGRQVTSPARPAKGRPSASNCRPNWTTTRGTMNRSKPRRPRSEQGASPPIGAAPSSAYFTARDRLGLAPELMLRRPRCSSPRGAVSTSHRNWCCAVLGVAAVRGRLDLAE